VEFYADVMELNIWTRTEFLGATYDGADLQWTARLRTSDGSVRVLRPSHLVLAIGVSGLPNIPHMGEGSLHLGGFDDRVRLPQSVRYCIRDDASRNSVGCDAVDVTNDRGPRLFLASLGQARDVAAANGER
jgi:hypothetical protein